MSLDFSRCRPVLLADGTWSGVKDHVKVGVQALIDHKFFALFDEMGGMKSAQVIIAAQMLFEMGLIHTVIVVAPSSVRDGVWWDRELGELRRHLWFDVPSTITEYHGRVRQWHHGPATEAESDRLQWVLTNYEFVRPAEREKSTKAKDYRLAQLMPLCDAGTWLVLDESSAVKSAQSHQTAACMKMRKACGRVTLLNGTPIADSPGDLFSQGNLMSPTILNCPSYTQFCARYAIMKPVLGPGGKPVKSKRGFAVQTVDKWSGLDDINRKFAPYVLRRLKKDCLDLPEKYPPIMLNVALESKTWAMYKQMRDELVVWLTQTNVSMAPQAMTKIMRLAQITSGFLGGVTDVDLSLEDQDMFDFTEDDGAPDYIKRLTQPAPERRPRPEPVQEVGREKLDSFMDWLDNTLTQDSAKKIVVRSCFRPEMLRLNIELQKLGGVEVGMIIGGQKPEARQACRQMLDPRTAPKGPAVGIMSIGAGSMGLNLSASHMLYTMSSNFNLKDRLQGDDRLHRPGQVWPVSYFDLVATGPQGQKTINHKTLAMLTAKDITATATTAGWLEVLSDEVAVM